MTQRRIYQEEYPYFISTKTKESVWFFDETKYAKLLSDIIFQACRLKKYTLYAYCIMPDHLHLLVKQMMFHLATPTAPAEGCAGVDFKDCLIPNPAWASAPAVGDGDYNISQLMHAIKSYFINELREKYNFNHPVWQKRFNSRIVDSEERLRNTINYILYNPIKAGLDKKYQTKPYIYINKKLIDSLFG